MLYIKRGFTLVELLVAVVVIFVVSSFMLYDFTGGFAIFSRSRNLTRTTFLAQEKMTELLNIIDFSADQSAHSGYGACIGTLFSDSNYSCQYRVTQWIPGGDYDILWIKVTSLDNGVVSELSQMVSTGLHFYGTFTDRATRGAHVAVSSFGESVGYPAMMGSSLPNSSHAQLISPTPCNNSPVVLGAGGVVGKVAGKVSDPDWNAGWDGDSVNHVIWYNAGSGLGYVPPGGLSPATTPTPQVSSFNPTGLATDAGLNELWVGDLAKNTIWKYHSLTNSNTVADWTPEPVPSDPMVSMQPPKPMGLATDEYSNVVWMVDAANSFLWLFDDNAGTWTHIPNPPSPGFSSPRGVATDAKGDVAYVVDQNGIWEFDSNIGPPGPNGPLGMWITNAATGGYPTIPFMQLPGGQTIRPSGISTDEFSGTFIVNDVANNYLWYYDGNGNWGYIPLPASHAAATAGVIAPCH